MRLLVQGGFYGTSRMSCHKNLGILCSQAQMNLLAMPLIQSFENGMALIFPASRHLIGSLLHHVAWFPSWTMTPEASCMSATLSPNTAGSFRSPQV
jgi:hypothetical protein